ncbi:hypothetical protein BDY19DRAFT_957182 [Irpex rosettiformis]|uniref:Uncharacterized protein n=1 Tax=Irpex rosettiformis TaxID=378272 RepID=A0ACB8TYJ9_9APHY|nr:hypothetical protein BDY19DRAFT_957182 [Irpex rosettiformis]
MGHLQDKAFIRHILSPYTPLQIRQYLRRISWPSELPSPSDDDHVPLDFAANVENLSRLMYLHCTTFPAENTDIHYTAEHRMPVRPDELFERMVVKHGGSYCFGQNGLFLGMLRGLGYRAYPVFGRVLVPSSSPYPSDPRSPIPDFIYTNQSHMLILVQPYPQSNPHLGNATFVVDISFAGLLGPIRPILLADGTGEEEKGGWVWGTFPPVRHRVVKGAHYASSLETSPGSGIPPLREWHMQVNKNVLSSSKQEGIEDSGWTTLYTFSEAEIFQRDIDTANFIAYTYDSMPFRDSVLCCKRLPLTQEYLERAGYSEENEVIRVVEAREDLQWARSWSLEGRQAVHRVGGKIVDRLQLGSELERVRFLRDVVGIGHLDEEDAVRWVEGRVAAF